MGKEEKTWILIYDRNEKTSLIPVEYLKQNGFHITIATDFDMAMQEVHKKQIGVILAVEQHDNSESIDFLEKMVREIPYIQRFLVANHYKRKLIQYAVNKAHINFFLKIPCNNILLAKTLREAVRRYFYVSKPYRKMDQMVGMAMDLVVDVEKYHKQATIDALTNILNRRSFDRIFERKILTYKKKKIIFTLAIIDLDRFKKVNDTYGHKAGDTVLARFAAILSKSTRSGDDMVFRYGGEEFAMISTGCDENEIKFVLDRILKNLGKTKIKYDNKNLKITFSAGIKAIDDNLTTGEELIKQADAALYYAKSHGRNQVLIYDKSEMGE